MTPEEKREYHREYQRRRRAADPDYGRTAARRWREANPEKIRERQARDGAKYRVKYLYGLSLEQWAQMVKDQGGCCYLCNEPLDLDNPRKIHTDHDHTCCRGARSCGTCVRGIACEPCNKGIGTFGDDPARMRRVADNLEAANRRVRSQQPVQALIPLAGDDAAAVTPRGEEMS